MPTSKDQVAESSYIQSHIEEAETGRQTASQWDQQETVSINAVDDDWRRSQLSVSRISWCKCVYTHRCKCSQTVCQSLIEWFLLEITTWSETATSHWGYWYLDAQQDEKMMVGRSISWSLWLQTEVVDPFKLIETTPESVSLE